MNLSTFIEFQTKRMKQFEQHWKTKIVPNMTAEDVAYWEHDATVWDWIEQFEESGV